jgi:BirA family biotin operon repressor/biotin-[acetyl-CoA-carboxylase] ligase
MLEIVEHHFESLPSTNLYAKEHLTTFPRDKITLISVDEQRAGRGRFGRKWFSGTKENLTLTLAFFIPEECQDPLSLTHVLALTLIEILEKKGLKPRLKWPNDVMIENKKIAGILCETAHHPPHFGVVIGLGLNVNMKEDSLLTVGQPATSIFVESSKLTDLDQLKQELAMSFAKSLGLFLKEGFTPFLPKFRTFILPGNRNL